MSLLVLPRDAPGQDRLAGPLRRGQVSGLESTGHPHLVKERREDRPREAPRLHLLLWELPQQGRQLWAQCSLAEQLHQLKGTHSGQRHRGAEETAEATANGSTYAHHLVATSLALLGL